MEQLTNEERQVLHDAAEIIRSNMVEDYSEPEESEARFTLDYLNCIAQMDRTEFDLLTSALNKL